MKTTWAWFLMGWFVFYVETISGQSLVDKGHDHGEICAEDLGFAVDVKNPEWETSISTKACDDPGYDISEMRPIGDTNKPVRVQESQEAL